MANPAHLARLCDGGIDEWNTWRRSNPGVAPDFRGANLMKVDLADDRGTGANLYKANLEGANLVGANLQGVNLREASMRGAQFGFTIFGNTNLKDTAGLENCQHLAPSVIDHQTFVRSWPLPTIFLRACGLPEILIEYLPSLLSAPMEFYSCFISYSTQDQLFADALYADLLVRGVRCWFAPEAIKIGDRFRQRIDDAIRLHDKLLLILEIGALFGKVRILCTTKPERFLWTF
jgi:Pentapeptide repeats (8 copies)/TIR domain